MKITMLHLYYIKIVTTVVKYTLLVLSLLKTTVCLTEFAT